MKSLPLWLALERVEAQEKGVVGVMGTTGVAVKGKGAMVLGGEKRALAVEGREKKVGGDSLVGLGVDRVEKEVVEMQEVVQVGKVGVENPEGMGGWMVGGLVK